MDAGANLTLQMTCYLQADEDVPSCPRVWALVPGHGGRPGGFAAAVASLAALAKPVGVGALNQPGYVAVWRPDGFDDAERRHVEHTVRNQQSWFDAKLAHLGARDAEVVLFEGCGTRVELPVGEVRRWLGEYALTWGWRLAPATDGSHAARLLVLKHGRRWSPGSTCSVAGAA